MLDLISVVTVGDRMSIGFKIPAVETALEDHKDFLETLQKDIVVD